MIEIAVRFWNSIISLLDAFNIERVMDIFIGKVRFFLGGGGLGPQRGGSSVKVSTKRGGPYLM